MLPTRLAALVTVLLCAAVAMPAAAGAVARISPAQAGLKDLDTRTGKLAPSKTQRRAVRGMKARVRWNRFGTPASLLAKRGFLSGAKSGNAPAVARGFIRSHRGLFRLSAADVGRLRLVNDSKLGRGHAVLFRQRFGGLVSGTGGMITVGVAKGRVAYVSSSAPGSRRAPARAKLSATQAWLRAAANAGVKASAGDVGGVVKRGGWTRFSVAGLATPALAGAKGAVGQRARLVAFPTYRGAVLPAFEALVLDADGGDIRAYRSFVDARTGKVLYRTNEVKQAAEDDQPAGSFSGTTADGADGCGKPHPINVTGAYSLSAFATANLPTDDIVLKLLAPNGAAVASSDTATSPEAVNYSKQGGIPDGTYTVLVCAFDSPTLPASGPSFGYTGGYLVNTVADTPSAPVASSGNPAWKFFAAAPKGAADNRITACFLSAQGCDIGLNSPATRAPWDVIPGANVPSLTTQGNAARTAEARTSPLTPGPYGYMPVAADRKYAFPFADQWRASGCEPTQLAVPGGGADIAASTVNLFSGHNRMHDFAYHLGFTELNYNLQQSNFGAGAKDGDPELGNVQAGALTGGTPSFLGRDNANQVTLNDGIPGITNQYLFGPIAGAFYSPCTDGSFDTSVFGHEYTHAISNRMVGGPDDGLTGFQGGAMGESWSDLVAMEYLHSHGYVPVDGENPWALGTYATGNKRTGIRDYALNANPLTFADVGFDTSGPEVHADGEIWNGVNYDIRQALVKKYDAKFPSGDRALQLRCADGTPGGNAPQGPLPADRCPGNRRWVQILFDAFLLQQGDTSMLTARDAYLAADRMRFGGADQAELWAAFAKRGMGASAATNTTEDDQPKPGFDSPLARNATVRFATNAPATIYLSRYEARTTPVADTDGKTALRDSVALVPGTYDVLVRAAGYGMRRSTLKVGAGQTLTQKYTLTPNWASKSQGATASGAGTNQADLIDDTEATTWDATDANGVDAGKPSVTIAFKGAKPVKSIAVSALLDPLDPDGDETRFTALRSFSVETCDGRTANCSDASGWKALYTSPADAFPAVAPRPLAPDLTLRTFDVPDTIATQIRLTALQNQCTGGPAYQGEQDADPTAATDCDEASDSGQSLHAAEFEVF